ncbi:S58 family peptidase [Caproiciproducens sp. NJN-50]|uniref:DmpA family aminopeptidase n=1 Tax=Acutalibacteraceae TaxID=3082771 RepID=UPI000FFE02DD|nr:MULTISPECIES: P1 family peptidase [Acutalibacteraceae]QAT50052.1 S58 family peptidase [Caproiciproducens sp. NJN-50]
MGLEHPLKNDICEKPRGKRNLITDVPGVAVGHVTLNRGNEKTGVTAILPQPDHLFSQKLPAASQVINGFGKSIGLVQIDELGTLETPILLTNTFAVGTAGTALVRYMLGQNPDIGDTTGTVNPVVLECNDGYLNDIRAMPVLEQHALEALQNAGSGFEEGAVGAGTGMRCYGLKGGIGSSSRLIALNNGKTYTLGCLVLSNFGVMRDLTIGGDAVGRRLSRERKLPEEKGSIIVVLATDLPLSDRQLKRICRRASVGITRTGSFIGNGSGEIAVAFSTANRVAHYEKRDIVPVTQLSENRINDIFRMTASVVEESILSSLVHAKTTEGRGGRVCLDLKTALKQAGTAILK